jgi:anthranilate synthase component 1
MSETNPSFSEFKNFASRGNVVPVYRTIVADLLSPVSAFLSLSPQHGRKANLHPHSFLLESVEGGERVGRYTFFGVDPFQIVSCRGDRITVRRGEAVPALYERHESAGRRPPLQTERRSAALFRSERN